MSSSDLHAAQRRGTVALAARELRRVFTLWTQTLLPPVVTAGLFLVIFGGALGARIDEVEGVRFLSFILPGLLVTTVAGQAVANAATSLYQARSEGYIDDILSSPLRGWQIVACYMAGSVARAFFATVAIVALALPFTDGIERPAVAVAALFLTGLCFGAVGVITGLWADTFDGHSFVAAIVIAPLALLGGVFYSARSLDEPWSTLTRLDPIYYLVDSTRAGFTGFHESSVWLSLLVATVVALTLATLAVALVARGWRLKP